MRKRGETLISIKWDAAIRPTRAPRSIHIWRSASRRALRARRLHRRRSAPSASVYPCASPAQYLTRAWMTSSSKGRTCSRTCARRGRLDGCESAEQVRRFCRSLVEEAEAGEGREPEGPELCEMCQSKMRRGGGMVCVRSTRGPPSSGFACMMRSCAIRASARQLFVIS